MKSSLDEVSEQTSTSSKTMSNRKKKEKKQLKKSLISKEDAMSCSPCHSNNEETSGLESIEQVAQNSSRGKDDTPYSSFQEKLRTYLHDIPEERVAIICSLFQSMQVEITRLEREADNMEKGLEGKIMESMKLTKRVKALEEKGEVSNTLEERIHALEAELKKSNEVKNFCLEETSIKFRELDSLLQNKVKMHEDEVERLKKTCEEKMITIEDQKIILNIVSQKLEAQLTKIENTHIETSQKNEMSDACTQCSLEESKAEMPPTCDKKIMTTLDYPHQESVAVGTQCSMEDSIFKRPPTCDKKIMTSLIDLSQTTEKVKVPSRPSCTHVSKYSPTISAGGKKSSKQVWMRIGEKKKPTTMTRVDGKKKEEASSSNRAQTTKQMAQKLNTEDTKKKRFVGQCWCCNRFGHCALDCFYNPFHGKSQGKPISKGRKAEKKKQHPQVQKHLFTANRFGILDNICDACNGSGHKNGACLGQQISRADKNRRPHKPSKYEESTLGRNQKNMANTPLPKKISSRQAEKTQDFRSMKLKGHSSKGNTKWDESQMNPCGRPKPAAKVPHDILVIWPEDLKRIRKFEDEMAKAGDKGKGKLSHDEDTVQERLQTKRNKRVKEVLCERCKKSGHIAKGCLTLIPEQEAVLKRSKNVSFMMAAKQNNSPHKAEENVNRAMPHRHMSEHMFKCAGMKTGVNRGTWLRKEPQPSKSS